MRLLITGLTGYLGCFVKNYLDDSNISYVSISRKQGLIGDLEKWEGGISELDFADLAKEKFDAFLHMAALYDLKASEAKCQMANVVATSNALRLALKLKIPHFINTSSIAAAINSPFPNVRPYDLAFDRNFPDYYSESKAQAEQLVQNFPGPFRRLNVRLGILVGDTQNGLIQRLDGPYTAIKLFESFQKIFEKWPGPLPIPGHETTWLPFVPVDYAAKSIVKLLIDFVAENDKRIYKSLHLVPEKGVGARQFCEILLNRLGLHNRKFLFMKSIQKSAQNEIFAKVSFLIRKLPELHYFFQMPKFITDGNPNLLEPCPEFEVYEKAFWLGYEKYISNR